MRQTLFALVTHRHAYAEKERLLDDEHQHGRYEESRETALQIVQTDIVVLHRHTRYLLVFACRRMQILLHLDVAVHVERDVVGGKQQRLVIEQGTHVAVQSDSGLLATPYILAECLRYAQHAVYLAFLQQLLCLSHIVASCHKTSVGRGIHLAYELAARRAVAVVDHRKRNIAHHLIGINIRIEQRIAQRYEYDEDKYALVAHYLRHLRHPYLNYVNERSFHYGTYLWFRNRL